MHCFGRDGHGLLGLETLKSTVSQEWTDEISRFFSCWYKLSKAKSFFNNYWVGMVKNEWGLVDHGTLKLGKCHKWFGELSILIEWFLHADSDGIIFDLMASPIYFVFYFGTIVVVLSQPEFIEKISFGQKWPQKEFFLYFEKFCQNWDLLKTYLNKNCSEIDKMGHDFGFMTSFWISATELFVIMNYFMITERN